MRFYENGIFAIVVEWQDGMQLASQGVLKTNFYFGFICFQFHMNFQVYLGVWGDIRPCMSKSKCVYIKNWVIPTIYKI